MSNAGKAGPLNGFWWFGALAALLTLLPGSAGWAQVLARPGWAGSGVSPEAWWPRAVFYRLDPARFQDSNGDGRGDLQGVVQRLDYLQSLGVDAVLLDGTWPNDDPEALGDLAREASRRHLRVLVTAGATLQQGPRTALIDNVRRWLAAGAAGVWLPRPAGAPRDDPAYRDLLSAVRGLVQSFPGARILLTDAAPLPVKLGPHPVRLPRRGEAARTQSGGEGSLVSEATLLPVTATAAQLRQSLAAASEGTDAGANPLLRLEADPPTGSARAVTAATLLLASRGAVVLDFGSEIGLDLYPATPAAGKVSAALAPPVMQWTPSNHTPEATPASESAKASQTPAEPVYGAYHPYQPPPRSLTAGMGAEVRVSADANVPEALPAPDSLPGFTAGALPAPPVDGAALNVITEDRDPQSLLNAYRQLIALHHDNATVRQGTEYVLPSPVEGSVVWIRRAPAGSRTVANVMAAVNLSDAAVTLAIDNELEALGMRPGALRPLFTSDAAATTGETTSRALLPPHGVLVAEIYHGGVIAPEPEATAGRHGARRGSRRSGHRVRR